MDDDLHHKFRRAQLGPKLAIFPLFDQIARAWWDWRRGKGYSSHEDDQWRGRTAVLSARLVRAIAEGDSRTLRLAADAVDLLDRIERDPDCDGELTPEHRLDFYLLSYYLNPEDGPPTIDRLIAHCALWMDWRIGWTIDQAAADKQIRRHCQALKLTIAPSNPGPKPK